MPIWIVRQLWQSQGKAQQPVIIKPVADTALSAFAFCELLEEAGLPKGWCQPIAVENLDVAGKMVEDKRVGFFTFIGSGRIGWMLKSRLAPGTHCALEHGGAAPVIVAEDADIDDMLPLLAKGGFYHAGQVCVSVQRIFVHESLFDQVSQGLVDLAKKMKSGDPSEKSTEIGPLIRHAEVDRIEKWVKEATSEGAVLATGGKRSGDAFYQPTVLLNPDINSKVSQQEIFGPVICVYSYTDMDEAIARANAVPFSFQASIFTKNIDTALAGWQNLEATAVMINDHTAFRVDWMPFGGEKESGYGIGGIPYTYRDMQIEKMAVIRSPILPN
jgi:acyl-CoA reductase-like NAD-dependent aldehyde dehydrogenase